MPGIIADLYTSQSDGVVYQYFDNSWRGKSAGSCVRRSTSIYAGGSTSTSTDTDTDSTIRLRAVNPLCNTTDPTNNSENPPRTQNIWEYNTGLHGIATEAPAFFDPSPDQPGDELVHFAVVDMGKANLKIGKSIQ